jgi:hypothetical protein
MPPSPAPVGETLPPEVNSPGADGGFVSRGRSDEAGERSRRPPEKTMGMKRAGFESARVLPKES